MSTAAIDPTLKAILDSRKPSYLGGGRFYWRCAEKDATDEKILAWPDKHLLPWRIYWGMSGSLGGYLAEYDDRPAALAALEHGINNPSKD